jgi:hypothetical protein
MLRFLGRQLCVAILVAEVCLGLCASIGVSPARAQPMRPWVPPASDSLLDWAAEARQGFRTAQGDSVSGANFSPYELVGRIARRMLRSLGRANMLQAHAIAPAIDSLGLSTEVAIDPTQPTFALVVVHNPFRRSAGSVAWLYWYREDDQRAQGLSLHGGFEPSMRVWWTADPSTPYEWAILDRTPGKDGFNLTLLRLDSRGYFWRADQYEGWGPDLSDVIEAGFMDVNRDGRPELLAWSKSEAESIFDACHGCPKILNERMYTMTPAGFELDDSRVLPSAYSTFVLFIRLLRQQNRAAAARLLEDPTKLDQLFAAGWAGGSGSGLWKIEYAETDRTWPRWLAVQLQTPKGPKHWIVHFTQKEGRWVIKDWLVPKPAPTGADTTKAKPAPKPAAKPAPKPGTKK